MLNRTPVGHLLREWRQRRRLSQLALACDAGISTRHLSFIETGRAQPSRDMVLHLSEQLVYTSPTDIFSLYVQLAMVAGIFVASPYVLYQVWGFISPGLYPHERRYAIPFVFLCSQSHWRVEAD